MSVSQCALPNCCGKILQVFVFGSCDTSTAFRGAVGKDSSDQIALLPCVTDTQPTLVTLQMSLVQKAAGLETLQ